jgi:hypothetical protein
MRMRRILPALSVLVLLCASSASAKKERQWQTGTLLDMNQASVYAGDVIVPNNLGAVSIARRRVSETYVIDAGAYVYESQEIRRSRDRTPSLTVNGPVQFAIEKDHVYIRDEEGKEHDTKLVKKTLKAPVAK